MTLIQELKNTIPADDNENASDHRDQWQDQVNQAFALEMNAIIDNLEQGSTPEGEIPALKFTMTNNLKRITEIIEDPAGGYHDIVPADLQGRYLAQSTALAIASEHIE